MAVIVLPKGADSCTPRIVGVTRLTLETQPTTLAGHPGPGKGSSVLCHATVAAVVSRAPARRCFMSDLQASGVAGAKRDLCGPMIPVITNLQPDLTVDHAAIYDNVQADVERGIATGQGVFLAGGAGVTFPC